MKNTFFIICCLLIVSCSSFKQYDYYAKKGILIAVDIPVCYGNFFFIEDNAAKRETFPHMLLSHKPIEALKITGISSNIDLRKILLSMDTIFVSYNKESSDSTWIYYQPCEVVFKKYGRRKVIHKPNVSTNLGFYYKSNYFYLKRIDEDKDDTLIGVM